MINVSTGLLTHDEIAIAREQHNITILKSGLGFAAKLDEPAVDRLAQFAYYAYGAQTNWKNYQGLPMPKWSNLPPNIRTAWRNSTKAVLSASGTLDGIASNAKATAPVFLGDPIIAFDPVTYLED